MTYIFCYNAKIGNTFIILNLYKTVQSSLFIYPMKAQLDCSKRMSQFTLKLTLNVNLNLNVNLM